MNIGMMWFNNDPKTPVSTRIEEAIKYYKEKYNKNPDICYCNPNVFTEQFKVGNVTVKSMKSILPGHFWIGID